MNVLKHMEAIFIAAALVAVPAAWVGVPDAQAPDVAASANADAMVASGARMATVTVTGKRPVRAVQGELLAAENTATRGRM